MRRPLTWFLLFAVIALAAGVRFAALDRPDTIYFDEASYAQDACTYVLAGEECGFESGASESSEEHPPLGKWLIGAGIAIFGYEPVGWRLVPALAGTATVGLLFVLARRLLASPWAAAVTAGLLAVDLLHVVMSRIAMLDVFVAFFALAAVILATNDASAHREQPLQMGPTWSGKLSRLATGAAVGAAVASKWSGAFVLPVVALVLLHAGGRSWKERSAWLRRNALSLTISLAVVPAVIYVASYAGRLDAEVLAAPWDPDSWVRTFLGRQKDMLEFHLDFDGAHPYASPAWSWPLVKRPVVFFFEATGGRIQEVLALGNPFLWWPALVAWLMILVGAVRRSRVGRAELIVVAGFAFLYGPWLLLTLQRSFAFLFYLLPALPFLYLGLVMATQRLGGRRVDLAQGSLVAVAVVSLAFFWPVLTASDVDADAWERRMVFGGCRADPLDDRLELEPGERLVPLQGPGRPPDGWCWI